MKFSTSFQYFYDLINKNVLFTIYVSEFHTKKQKIKLFHPLLKQKTDTIQNLIKANLLQEKNTYKPYL